MEGTKSSNTESEAQDTRIYRLEGQVEDLQRALERAEERLNAAIEKLDRRLDSQWHDIDRLQRQH